MDVFDRKRLYSLSSSSDEEEYCVKPLSVRLAERSAFDSKPCTKTSKSTVVRSHRAETHSLSDSDDNDDILPRNESEPVRAVLPSENEPNPVVICLDDDEDNINRHCMPSPSSPSKTRCSPLCSQKNELLSSLTNSEESAPSYPCSSSLDFKSHSSDHLIVPRKQPKVTTRLKSTSKKEVDADKLKAKEKKQQEKLLAKALKDVEAEVKRSAKSQECLKSMRLAIDERLTNVGGSEVLLNTLLDSEISYTLEKNHIPQSVVWYRRVADIDIVDNQVLKQERDQLEHMLLLYISSSAFVDMVHSCVMKNKGKSTSEKTLCEHITDIQEIFPKMKITCVTVGLDNYLKMKNDSEKNAAKNSVLSQHVVGKPKKVLKRDIDDAIVELHLQCFVNYCPLNTMTELANLLTRFTKAIAEAPFKWEKQQQEKAFSWYAQADSSCPVKIDKDGRGSIDLWQQQICQFNSIGREVAQAIAAQYPSPLSLVEAYKHCASETEAQKLLQDIVVRRTYGPLGTTRRVGPELSYKMHMFFTSKDGKELLQR